LTRDHRRLAAIVSADVVGYSLLMGRDDSATLAGLKAHRRELIDPKIAEYGGRIVKTTGDGLLLEFPSVVDAVRCAVDVQRGMAERNAGVPPQQRIAFRIGINVGDIIIDGEDIFGDGVNVAARLQTLAEPGGICVSRVVRDQVLDKLSFTFEDLGPQDVKNIARPVEAYRVYLGTEVPQTPRRGHRRWKPLARALRSRWLAASVLALGIVGIAVWALPQFWKTAAPAPPAMSVAIAPLMAPHGDADASRFAEALTHDLITGLGRAEHYRADPRAQVVSGNSAAAGSSGQIDARELGRRLNARYVLEGDVHRGGDGDTVNLRLVDTATGQQVWAKRDTLEESDVSAKASTKRRNLIDQLRDALYDAESRRVMIQSLSDLSATELVLRAWAVWDNDNSITQVIEARKLVDEALRRDPNLVAAVIARVAFADLELAAPDADRDRLLHEIDEGSSRAVNLDTTDPMLWLWRSLALRDLGRWEAALEANAMATKLDPDNSASYANRAVLLNRMGRPVEALAMVDRALALNGDSDSVELSLRAACRAHLLIGQAELAVADCEKALGIWKSWATDLSLAAAYANQGDMAKAAAAKTRALQVMPGFTIARARALDEPFHPEYLKLAEKYWYEGLRKAGFPEQ
jgi:adenylate cyclase